MLYLILLLFLLICAGLVGLTVLNLTTQVHLTVMTWQSPDLPIGFWLIMAFFLGAVLLYFVSVASAFSDRREMKKLQAKVSQLEEEHKVAEKAPSQPVSTPENVAPPRRPTGPLMPMPGAPSSGSDLPTQKFRP